MTLAETLGLYEETHAASWSGWRSLAARVDGREPEDPAFVERVTQRTDRIRPKKVFAICGRGAGKSRFGAMVAAAFATRSYKRVVGENIYVGIFAPDRRQATVSFRYVEGLLTSSPVTASLVQDQTQSSVTLANGVIVEVLTADFRAVRSRAYALAIVEEAAFLPTDNSATPDTELLRALRPALARVAGSMLMVLSSPYARRGELYRAHRQHFGKATDTLVIEASTLDLNPTFDRAEIEAAYVEDPVAAASEYGAIEPAAQPRISFRSDVETFISREALDAVTVAGLFEAPAVSGVTYQAFLDFAGGSGGDSATAAVAHGELRGEQTVAVLDAVREVKPPFSPASVAAEFASFLKGYGVMRAVSDRWGGLFPVEEMAKHGVTVTPSAKPKSDLYAELLPLINSKRVELLDHPRLLAQLAGLERRTARGGKDSIDHAPGANAHDDVANAVAGALTLAAVPVETVNVAGVVEAGLGVPREGGSPWAFGVAAGEVTDVDFAGNWRPKGAPPRNPFTI